MKLWQWQHNTLPLTASKWIKIVVEITELVFHFNKLKKVVFMDDKLSKGHECFSVLKASEM